MITETRDLRNTPFSSETASFAEFRPVYAKWRDDLSYEEVKDHIDKIISTDVDAFIREIEG